MKVNVRALILGIELQLVPPDSAPHVLGIPVQVYPPIEFLTKARITSTDWWLLQSQGYLRKSISCSSIIAGFAAIWF